MDPYIELAKETIKLYLTKEDIPDPKTAPKEITARHAGCFVSVYKNGKLRGCIGTIVPVYKNLAGEIIANAVAAATTDPRFESIKKEEVDEIEVSIDVLTPPEQIFDDKDLDPKKYGVIVQADNGRDGLLLPDIKGVDTIDQQIDIARTKGNIKPDEQISLFRFEVERHKN